MALKKNACSQVSSFEQSGWTKAAGRGGTSERWMRRMITGRRMRMGLTMKDEDDEEEEEEDHDDHDEEEGRMRMMRMNRR